MTNVRIIGDVHGHISEMIDVVNNTPESIGRIIQVGDIGIGFGQGEYWHVRLDDFMQKNRVFFLRGNHDNPKVSRNFENNLEAGIFEDLFIVPGAWSIDQRWRIPGESWWEDEELSYQELEAVVDLYEKEKPRIVITHDFPESAASKMFFDGVSKPLFGRVQYKTRTASALETMLNIHRPDLWIAGHWHYDADMTINGTRFLCLNEMTYVDIKTETAEVVLPPLWSPIK